MDPASGLDSPLISGVREPDGTFRLDQEARSGLGISCTVFDAAGNPVGGEFQIDRATYAELVGRLHGPVREAAEALSRAMEPIAAATETMGSLTERLIASVMNARPEPRDLVIELTADTTQFAEALMQMGASRRLAPAPAASRGPTRFDDDRDMSAAVPLTDADRDWKSYGNTCAHVCGADPGHACDARATTTLKHPLPSGGVRDLPLCSPCAQAEAADSDPAPTEPPPIAVAERSMDLDEMLEHFSRLRPASDFLVPADAAQPVVPPGRVSTVCAGLPLDDEHRQVLDAYREAHRGAAGMPWTGETLSDAMVNAAVDWWNREHAEAGDE
jgi:hypothetical protein